MPTTRVANSSGATIVRISRRKIWLKIPQPAGDFREEVADGDTDDDRHRDPERETASPQEHAPYGAIRTMKWAWTQMIVVSRSVEVTPKAFARAFCHQSSIRTQRSSCDTFRCECRGSRCNVTADAAAAPSLPTRFVSLRWIVINRSLDAAR